MLVKICGITDPQTAVFAVQKGAQYIGILFSKLSPRAVTLEMARDIVKAVRAAGAEPVGVFADETKEEILKISQELNLNIVQLHGKTPRKAIPYLPMQKIYVVDDQPLPHCLDPTRDFLLFEKRPVHADGFRFFIAGGLNSENLRLHIEKEKPNGVDVSSGVEKEIGKKDPQKIEAFIRAARPSYFGSFGGMFAPELLVTPLFELEHAFETIVQKEPFEKEYLCILEQYVGRPTALTEVPRLAQAIEGPRIFLKREDLTHTGAHKINNAIGQCLLAQKMGKTRVIAETGAGMHGVAVATACALFGLECVIYMGQTDIERQAPNVAKMRLLGARVVATKGTLKDAVNEALRDWASSYETTHYCLGSALGPHPFPAMVAYFQRVIGQEAKKQMLERVGRDPDYAIACVGGGSNAIGLFSAYINDPHVQLIGVEAGGKGKGLGSHAARFLEGSLGILHGAKTYVLQDEKGQIAETHSISAGLDYPAVGPQHAEMYVSKRARYETCSDQEAVFAFELLSRTEGIIPALESAHALGYLVRIAKELPKETIVLINLSGRGEKDLPKLFEEELSHVAHR